MAGVAIPQMRQKKDPLDDVVRGLQIAQSVYGIKTDMAKLEQYDAEQKAAAQKASDTTAGIRTPAELAELSKTHTLSETEAPGAVKLGLRKPDGSVSPVFASVRQKAEAARGPEKVTGVVKDGKPHTRLTYPDGRVEWLAEHEPPRDDKGPGHETDLRKEYTSHPVTKDTGVLTSSWRKIEGIGRRPNPTGADDMSLIFAYMKMLDPGSTVREGEYAAAENTRGIPEQVVAAYNKAREGVKLSPEQRASFVGGARTLLGEQLSLQADQDERYSSLARGRGLDPVNVIDPTWQKARSALEKVASNPRAGAGEAQAAPAPAGGQAPAGGAAPGAIVRVNGKLFTVGADGDTLIPYDEGGEPVDRPGAR